MSTGLKANSDGSAAIQVGGTDVITLTSGGAATFVTSPTTVQAGTAAAPSITFSGDTNTGIYSPGADTVGLTAGGTLVGSVGLGTTLALQGATSQSGTGITFPATQSASSNANTLDDYEEGTWTATLVSTGGGTVTLATNARCTKVGNLVFVGFESNDKSITGLSAGSLTITGLPFAVAGANPGIAYFQVAGATSAAVGACLAYANDTTTITIYKSQSTTSSLTNLTKADLNNIVSFRFNAVYTV